MYGVFFAATNLNIDAHISVPKTIKSTQPVKREGALTDSYARIPPARTTVLAIALVTLFLLIPSSAFAQLTPNYTVGTAAGITIDGVWEPGEWTGGVELTIAHSNLTSIPPAYLRLAHDESWLYFIYDVPFDTTQPTQASQLPFIALVLDGTAARFTPSDQNDIQLVSEITPSGETAVNYVGYNNPSYHPYLGQYIRNVTIVGQKLGTSPHSNVPHRIWEGRIPLQPIIMNSPKAGDLSPVIGFNTEVQDALGNWEQLQPLSDTYGVTLLKIAPYPVPENLNLVTPLLLVISILGIYTLKRKRKART